MSLFATLVGLSLFTLIKASNKPLKVFLCCNNIACKTLTTFDMSSWTKGVDKGLENGCFFI